MNSYSPSDVLHRLVKHALDSGKVATMSEAEALFRGYRVAFRIGQAEAQTASAQATLLTGVALARRVFLGGVSVDGALNVPLRVPLPLGANLASAVEALGGIVSTAADETPLILVGGEPRPQTRGFQIRSSSAGWRAGIVPAHSEVKPIGLTAMPLASMLAASLAVNEVFLHVNGGLPAAGRRIVGLSLWRPDPAVDWLIAETDEPELTFLPSRLWMIGLGHLGQAYLWGLGLLPYPDPSGLSLVLQDIDVITPSSESTSILTERAHLGEMKTRAMAAWAARRGFGTAIQERLFDASFQRQASEPSVALCGLDNALGRLALDKVGFDFVAEAGLGRGHRDFRTMRLHTLPGTRQSGDLWKAANADGELLEDRPAYRRMLENGELDRCGVTLLAGKAVGAPFVGATAACLALSEVLRILHGGPLYQFIDLDLQCIEHRVTVPNSLDFGHLNPGYVVADR